jgi:hypothetical protein
MDSRLVAARPEAGAGQTTFRVLAAREMRRFVLNPIFLAAAGLTAFALWSAHLSTITEIDGANTTSAVFFGGLGMVATFWLTQSTRASEPVLGVTPTTRAERTAALCTVAVAPFACGVLTLLAFLHFLPVSSPVYGAFSQPARIAVLAGQIVVPALGGPLLGVALGRWVRFPGAALVLLLLLFAWVNLVTFLSVEHPDSAPIAVLRLFAPFALFTQHSSGAGITAWRGSPWFFIGWQLALCAIAVLVALLRGAEGPVRSRIVRGLAIAGAVAVIMLVLAGTGGFTHAVTT